MTDTDTPRAFCVIWGTHRPFDIDQKDTIEANTEIRRYVDRIVYGQPSRIFGIYTGRGTFVSLVEWSGEDAAAVAGHTMKRMPSFPHGCSLTFDVDVAFKEFGSWVCHYSGTLSYEVTRFDPETDARMSIAAAKRLGIVKDENA